MSTDAGMAELYDRRLQEGRTGDAAAQEYAGGLARLGAVLYRMDADMLRLVIFGEYGADPDLVERCEREHLRRAYVEAQRAATGAGT